MPRDLKLMKVVAFNAAGQAVLVPLHKWKLAYSARKATLEVRCAGYAKTYNLREDVVAAAPTDSRQKVAVGKTLGRLALTGVLHGRQAVGADLRWGGVDRDEAMTIALIFSDTTVISMEVDGDEADELLENLQPEAVEEEAYKTAAALSRRIKAMADDGPRVLTEIDTQANDLSARLEILSPLVDGGASFDERNQAREETVQTQAKLEQLRSTRLAVLYELSAAGRITDAPSIAPDATLEKTAYLRTANETTADPAVIASTRSIPSDATNSASSVRSARRKTSLFSKVVTFVVFLVGACVGLAASLLAAVLIQPYGIFAMPFLIIGGGWIGVRMLSALLRR